MFENKQPKRRLARLYKVAAIIAKEYSEGLGSIKQLVYAKRDKHPRIQALYALVNTLYQRKDEIQRLLKKTQLLESESRADPWVIKILITELLYGKKVLSGQTKIEQTIKGYEQIFKAHLSDSIEVPVKAVICLSSPKTQTSPKWPQCCTKALRCCQLTRNRLPRPSASCCFSVF
ncbi:unnamed protein product [Callosobruchus maculatus]|uniref:NSUN5/RCM1 N-terminal domain-containing protein n=1 Tax=Callosobruchus maculatus TaxID=64391 RepID=A0A653C486_CALMS|nr:unnamed protein product [Callosobruchus maculatus]